MSDPLGAVSSMANKAAEFLFGQVGMTHRFMVQFDSGQYNLGDWAKVSGLQVQWNKIELRTGATNYTWIGPGNTSYPNIELSRAACSASQTVQSWLQTVSHNNAPQSGVIQMVDFTGMSVVSWQLNEFFPIGWKIVEFDASGSKPAIETLTIAHTGFLGDEMTYRGK